MPRAPWGGQITTRGGTRVPMGPTGSEYARVWPKIQIETVQDYCNYIKYYKMNDAKSCLRRL
jgi:hypothetical protein